MPAARRRIWPNARYGVCSSYGRLRPHRTRPPLGLDLGRDLLRQPRLPDPRGAEHRDQVRGSRRDGAIPHGADQQHLAVASDERRRRGRPFRRRHERTLDEPRLHRIALALRVDGVQLSVVERVAGEPVGLGAHHGSANGRRGLEAGRRVDHVAGGEGVGGRGVDGDHRLARAHGGAHLEVEVRVALVQLRDAFQDAEGRAHGPLRIVASRERRAEHRHHRIPDVLLDRAAVPFDPAADLPVVELVAITDVLGVRAVGTRGGAHDVDEQHRDELALLRHGGAADRGPARRAESGVAR